MNWSYALLEPAERDLFERVATFIGGFTLTAAESICSDTHRADEVADLIRRLVDRSLVAVDRPDESVRYRLLETLRAYGLDLQIEHGRREHLREMHAGYYLALAERAWHEFRGPTQPAWLERLETEHGNIGNALDWSLGSDNPEIAVRLAGSVAPFWDLHGHYTEGRIWLERALTLDGDITAGTRIRALNGLATLAIIQGDLGRAVSASEDAAILARADEDWSGLAYALHYLGFAAVCSEELDRAADLLEESMIAARRTEELWLEGWSMVFLTTVELARDDYARADELGRKSKIILTEAGEPEGMAWAEIMQAGAAWGQHDYTAARGHASDGLSRMWQLKAGWGLSVSLLIAGQVARSERRWERAAILYGASEKLRESVGAALVPFVRRWRDDAVAELRTALGSTAFERRRAEGSAMFSEKAILLAATDLGATPPAPPQSPQPTAKAASPPAQAVDTATLQREGEFWSVRYSTPVFRLKDSTGLRYLARLVSAPNHEFHALGMAGPAEGSRTAPMRGGLGEVDLHLEPGYGGPVLDGRARSAYRRRLRDLATEVDEAVRWNDLERADRATREVDAITEQRASAVGLGGRDRRAAAAAERARVNVTKAIRSAIERIGRHDPAAELHRQLADAASRIRRSGDDGDVLGRVSKVVGIAELS